MIPHDTGQTRDEAARESRRCGYCGGSGTLHVFHPRYDGRRVIELEAVDRDGEIRVQRFPAVVVAHCLCPLGRWVRCKTDPDLLPRIPDLAAILEGRSRWLHRDPTREGDGPAPMAPDAARGRLGERLRAR